MEPAADGQEPLPSAVVDSHFSSPASSSRTHRPMRVLQELLAAQKQFSAVLVEQLGELNRTNEESVRELEEFKKQQDEDLKEICQLVRIYAGNQSC